MTIREWLDTDGDYLEGLALLGSSPVSSFLWSLLSSGENTYNRNRLREELAQLVPVEPVAIETPVKPAPAQEHANRPASVLELESQARTLMNERVELKAQLRMLISSPDALLRQANALRILAIGKELDAIYGKIGFWKEHGYLPLDQTADEAQEQVLTLLNVRTYVSRYKGLLKRLPDNSPRLPEAQRLLAYYEGEKTRLEHENRARTF